MGSVDTNLLTPAVVFITFIDITVGFIFRVFTVRNSVANLSQRNTAGVSAEKLFGEITGGGEVGAVRLVLTLRTVRSAVTELVASNTLAC